MIGLLFATYRKKDPFRRPVSKHRTLYGARMRAKGCHCDVGIGVLVPPSENASPAHGVAGSRIAMGHALCLDHTGKLYPGGAERWNPALFVGFSNGAYEVGEAVSYTDVADFSESVEPLKNWLQQKR